MKHFLFTVLLALATLTTFSQDSLKTKDYRNEFGIDGTAFIKQFFNFNSGQFPTQYVNTYYLTYRRLYKCGNIRFAVGGSYSSNDINNNNPQDDNQYRYEAFSLNSRIGWEFFSNLSTRWQVFYGLDFRPTFQRTKNDVMYWTSGYANGFEDKMQLYAIAPLLGFRFRLTDRLSISTEASFSLNWSVNERTDYFTPQSSMYPSKPDIISPKTKRLETVFQQPISLFVTFDI